MRLLCCQFRKPSLAMGHLHTPWVTQRGSGWGWFIVRACSITVRTLHNGFTHTRILQFPALPSQARATAFDLASLGAAQPGPWWSA
jgi:hypothetical protein